MRWVGAHAHLFCPPGGPTGCMRAPVDRAQVPLTGGCLTQQLPSARLGWPSAVPDQNQLRPLKTRKILRLVHDDILVLIEVDAVVG